MTSSNWLEMTFNVTYAITDSVILAIPIRLVLRQRKCAITIAIILITIIIISTTLGGAKTTITKALKLANHNSIPRNYMEFKILAFILCQG